MKEIKFKVLNKFTNRILPETQLDIKSILELIKFKRGCMWLDGNEWFEFLEYTGQTDNNNIEIYNGNIVQFTAFGRTVRGLVEWDVDDGLPGFVIVDTDGSGTIWDFMYDDLTVIGNRYETPELLEPPA